MIATAAAHWQRLENAITAVLAVMAICLHARSRPARAYGGIAGSIPIVQHLTLWISFLGAALAARSDRLLALSTASFLPERWRARIGMACAVLGVAITSVLCGAAVQLVAIDREFGGSVALGVPVWAFTAIMPVGFALLTARLVWHAGTTWPQRALAASGVLVAVALALAPEPVTTALFWPAVAAIVLAGLLGMPIYAALGGAALLLFFAEGTPVSAVPGEAYRMATSPMLPAIPLFTLAGYILAEAAPVSVCCVSAPRSSVGCPAGSRSS
jgi:TRAP-type C4-dicarboxylate transport system permease small subunit